jgi:hypothetical protein
MNKIIKTVFFLLLGSLLVIPSQLRAGTEDVQQSRSEVRSTTSEVRGVTSELLPITSKVRLETKEDSDSLDRELDLISLRTFSYFWDLGHAVSGLARERASLKNVTTTGGTGFGIMALITGVERKFISRRQCLARLHKIVAFLSKADRFHGAWPHWLDGITGRTIPFSRFDDGGDLVETSFLLQGLLCARQYFDGPGAEKSLREIIDSLWQGVDWNFYTRGKNVLYWHWSPNYAWAMDMPILGWNEALVTYVLAAGSPSSTISPAVYHEGWARSGAMVNGKSYYGIKLPLGPKAGGPLFLSHYSFLGLDPRGLSDRYGDYWLQNVNHSLINYEHCVQNPLGWDGYGPSCWGLTSSDSPGGYEAHSPDNDLGVISPTAAVSAIVYTPKQSLAAIRHFQTVLDGRVLGPFGFYDAFQPSTGWVDHDYLAIDQGPIVVMIENFRSGLLWRLFMSCPEISQGLSRLRFKRESNE